MKNTVFAVLWGVIVCTGLVLGQWQLDRLAWKTAWLDQIESAYQSPGLKMPTGPVDLTFFSRGELPLQFDQNKIFVVKPRIHEQTFGAHLYQWAGPFPDGAWYWVNRGFVADHGTIKSAIDGTRVMVQIRGPDFKWADVQHDNPGMAHEPAPVMIGVIEPHGANETYPIAVGTRPNPPNDHLHYAIFWFTMSAVALVMGVILIVRRATGRA